MVTTVYIKKVIRIGGSLAIILPSKWVREKVKAGQEMVVVGNGELHIFPLRGSENVKEGNGKNGTICEA